MEAKRENHYSMAARTRDRMDEYHVDDIWYQKWESEKRTCAPVDERNKMERQRFKIKSE